MAQSLTQNFVDSFRKGAYAESLSPEVQTVLLTVAIAVIVLSSVGLYVAYARRRRIEREARTHLLNEPKAVRAVLTRAMDNRARIDLCFLRLETPGRFTPAAIETLEENALELHLSENVQAGDDWIGREVEGYFRLPRAGEPDQPRFYAFVSDIRQVRRETDGVRLRLPLPLGLTFRQKRQHLRVEPPTSLPVGLALWPLRTESDGSMPCRPDGWGRPAAEVVFGRKGTLLQNLSGGGFRLGIVDYGGKHMPDFAGEDRFLVRLDLPEPGRRSIGRTYLVAAVRAASSDFTTRRKEIGFKFLYQGTLVKDRGLRLQWSRLEDDRGAEAVDKWVFRRHTERYRSKAHE